MGGSVLDVHDAHHTTIYAKFRTPPGIVNRDFVYDGFHGMLDEHTSFSLGKSVERSDCPPSKDTYSWVRGEIQVSGYIAQDCSDDNGCELTYIVQADPKGWLPTWVVNLVAADQADNVTRIANYFKKEARKGNVSTG